MFAVLFFLFVVVFVVAFGVFIGGVMMTNYRDTVEKIRKEKAEYLKDHPEK